MHMHSLERKRGSGISKAAMVAPTLNTQHTNTDLFHGTHTLAYTRMPNTHAYIVVSPRCFTEFDKSIGWLFVDFGLRFHQSCIENESS